jgi:hypothetical protein
MSEKDTTKVYYCTAGGHFWRWQWSPENGGYYFPAFIADVDDKDYNPPDDYEKKYCGCND